MTALSARLILLLASAFTMACEADGPTETRRSQPPRFEPAVFTTLGVEPSSVTILQGWEVQLVINTLDQRRAQISVSGETTFSSSDSTVASVSRSGMVTGTGPGAAVISVTKTIAGVTRSATMNVTIIKGNPLASLVLRAGEDGWQPQVAHLAANGTAQWVTSSLINWEGQAHGKLYLMNEKYAEVDSLDLNAGSATHKFTSAGKYHYCSGVCWDPPDWGTIYVH